MKSFMRNALLGTAGLVALSLSAHAAGTTSVIDTLGLKSSTTSTKPMQMARDENPGGGGAFKQSKKTKKKEKAKE
jgi:hypothetical protein